ncbi:MAG TPA: lipopolysaccharide biosynthesis protein [Pirellulales bacterium]|nr:lipopolysaccharide biosynthesis protein [Pirellulales bacterium]
MSSLSTTENVLGAASADLPAPVTGWGRLAADLAAVGGSGMICQGLGIVTSLVLRGALDPAHMGVWQGLKLLLGYANYANLGISKGAARELAIATGSGEQARAERSLNLAFTVNTLTSLIYGGCLLAAAVWVARGGASLHYAWSTGLLLMAALVVLQRHLTFHVTILRCRQAFTLTSWVSLLEGLLTLALAGLGAWCWGLSGLLAGTLLTMAAAIIFLRRQGAPTFRFAWQWTEIRRLVAIGGPILLGGAALNLFQSLDRLMLLGFSPEREVDLGLYSTTLLITGQIYGLANLFAMVVAPRYAELFGKSGSRREVARFAARASELVAAVASIAGVLGLVVAAPLLGHLFVDYRPGLRPAAWLVPGTLMLAVTLPLHQYLVAVCRERVALVASVAALALTALGDYAVLAGGQGMLGIAAITSVAYGLYCVALFFLSLWPELDGQARRRYIFTHVVLLAFPIALAVVFADPASAQSDPVRFLSGSLAALAACVLALTTVWRWGGWDVAWRTELAVLRPRPSIAAEHDAHRSSSASQNPPTAYASMHACRT